MLRNWYAVYTKSRREKKVSSILAKRGIESYCPVNYIFEENPGGKKGFFEPLFASFVFVNISDPQMATVKNIPGVINLVYWKSKPAVISSAEIDAVKQITEGYMNIKLERAAIGSAEGVLIVDEPVFSYNENSVRVKYHTLKVVLPSLGYMLVAEKERVRQGAMEPVFEQFSLLPKRLAALFTN